jgi:HEAT repeat protein
MRRLVPVSLLLVVIGCGKTQQDYTVPSLIKALKDKDPAVRYTAAEALGRYGPEAKDAVPALTETLKDSDKNVRIGAAYALANIGPDARTAIPALEEALKDEDNRVRKGAAYALKELQNPTARPPRKTSSKTRPK